MANPPTGANTRRAIDEGRFVLRRSDRLHKHAEFTRVQRKGLRFQTAHFVIYGLRFPETQNVRLGTAVSRRLGNAVIRNRIKRRLRESFRLTLRPVLPPGTAVVIIARAGAGVLRTPEVANEIAGATQNLRVRLVSS